MKICHYVPIRILDVKEVNKRFDQLYRQTCFLAGGSNSILLNAETAFTPEAVSSDTTILVTINGVEYKLLAKA